MPGFLCRSKIHPRDLILGHHQCEASHGCFYQLSCPVYDCTHRRRWGANHFVACNECTKPMREIDDLGCSDPWKQVFIPTRKTNHLVWEHRSTNDDLIVIKNMLIERNG